MKRFLKYLASLSRKKIIGYCVLTTVLFLFGGAIFLTGALFLPPNPNETPSWALPLTIAGAVILVLVLFSILFMSIGSNYGNKYKEEDDRAEVEREEEEEEEDSSDTPSC